MNGKNTQAPERRSRIVIRKNDGGAEGIHTQSLIFIVSALLLLFSLIVAVTIALCEAPKNTPPVVRPGDSSSGGANGTC